MTDGEVPNAPSDAIDLANNAIFVDSELTEVEAMLLNLEPNDTLF